MEAWRSAAVNSPLLLAAWRSTGPEPQGAVLQGPRRFNAEGTEGYDSKFKERLDRATGEELRRKWRHCGSNPTGAGF